jgi:hypothetical protein
VTGRRRAAVSVRRPTRPVLPVIQAVSLYQAALRGTDYLRLPAGQQETGLGVVEQAAPLQVWGWLFYGSVVLALLGIAARRPWLTIVGHGLLGCWYAGVGIGLLQTEGAGLNPLVVTGALIGGGGAWLVFRRSSDGTTLRLLAGVPAMLAGQWLLAVGLGDGYRSGTGLISGAVIQFALATVTWLAFTRQRLTAQIEREHGVTLEP